MLREGMRIGFLSTVVLFQMVEVEFRVKDAVDNVVAESSVWMPYRTMLVDKLISALETDAGWVDIYGVTGELDVPGLYDRNGEIGVALSRVKSVNFFLPYCALVDILCVVGSATASWCALGKMA
jgi:hypothetical protein